MIDNKPQIKEAQKISIRFNNKKKNKQKWLDISYTNFIKSKTKRKS